MPTYLPASNTPATATAYEARCHCGAVTLTIRLPKPLQSPESESPEARLSNEKKPLAECPVYKVNQCSCSVCHKFGYILVYPYREDVEWHTGYPDAVKGYRFGTKTREHLFCTTCGTSLGIDYLFQGPSKDEYGINAKLLKGVDLEKCAWSYFDGIATGNELGWLLFHKQLEP